MFDLFKKKEKQTPKRKTSKYYYPKMKIDFIKRIVDDFETVEVLNVNYCCETIKKYSDIEDRAFKEYFYFSRWGRFLTSPNNPHTRDNVHYCPFCGARIILNCVKKLEKVRVGCDEVVEPEKVIPAKTRKVPRFKWEEVKQ